jgi:hypothetical protein
MGRVGLLAALVIASTLGAGAPAFAAPAADTEEPGGAEATPAASSARSAPGSAPGAASAEAAAPPADPAAVVRAPAPASLSGPPVMVAAPVYGVGVRARWVTVPHWFLSLFTKHNVPLSTFGHFGIEGFRRQGNFEISLAFSHQDMSPPDGNWLGSGHDPMIDTRFLQFRGVALYTADIAFLWHDVLTSWFGLHAGAGLGAGFVTGKLYPNVSQGCTNSNLDNLEQCHPPGLTCANGVCTTGPAFVQASHSDILPVIPIVNLVFGVDFRLPNVNGWEAKLEAGFYDAFFAGFGVGYTF